MQPSELLKRTIEQLENNEKYLELYLFSYNLEPRLCGSVAGLEVTVHWDSLMSSKGFFPVWVIKAGGSFSWLRSAV